MYVERPSHLPGLRLWRRAGGETLVLPDGCMDLIRLNGDVVVAGPDTGPVWAPAVSGTAVGLRFGPGQLPALLGVPASELCDRLVALSDLVGSREARSLNARLDASAAPGAVLERYAATRSATAEVDPRVRVVARMLAAGHTVRDAAAHASLSPRQLRRLAHQHFGYHAKLLSQVLRLQRAIVLLSQGLTTAHAAAAAGYADQAHLTRETRRLAGTTPGRLRAADTFKTSLLAAGSIRP